MNVHVSEDLVRRLNELAAASGRNPDELVQEALAGYLDELAVLSERLNTRYDDVKAGRVQTISGDAAAAHLREKSRLRKAPSA